MSNSPRARVRAAALPLYLIGSAMFVCSAAASAPAEHQKVADSEVPHGIAPQAWADILACIAQAEYAAAALPSDPDTISAHNPGQDLQLRFDGQGSRVESVRNHVAAGKTDPRNAEIRMPLQLQTQAMWRGTLRQQAEAVRPVASGARIEYRREGWTEWFINSPVGLEHGYTLDQRPLDISVNEPADPLKIVLTVSGMRASAGTQGSLLFTSKDGRALGYKKLLVTDADGLTLPASMTAPSAARIEIAIDDSGARYPITIDPLLVNLEASVNNPGDTSNLYLQGIGYSVALDGEHLLVGAPNAQGYGVVYALIREGSSWTMTQQIKSSDLTFGFGTSVALSGNTALIGASSQQSAGMAYVFGLSSGIWTRQASLSSPTGSTDKFGRAVALSGNRALVGAPSIGAVYAFVRSGETDWAQQQVLLPTNAQGGGDFGASIALGGDVAAIGQPLLGSGSAYVFVASGDSWSVQAKVKAPDDDTGPIGFGSALALSGETLLVGAPDGDAAYAFVRSDVNWKRQAKLVPADGITGNRFGSSVSVSGDQAAVGAPGESSAATTTGSTYVFLRTGTAWTQQAKLQPTDLLAGDSFGQALAIADGVLIAGAWGDDVGSVAGQGSVRLFTGAGTSWAEQAPFTFKQGGPTQDHFGHSVALYGNTALIGVPDDDIGANLDQGSAYVFVRSGEAWTQQARLKVADGKAQSYFGKAVALYEDTALIGAYNAKIDYASQGSAYVFTRSGSTWTQQARLIPISASENDQFGSAVSLEGDTALVAANRTKSDYYRQGTGYVFARSGTGWTEQARLDNLEGPAHMGCSTALSGDTALIGSCENSTDSDAPASVAYAFVLSGDTWSQQASLFVDLKEHSDPVSVALSGDIALIGYGRSVYAVYRSSTEWSQQATLVPADSPASSSFGGSVALRGDTALVGDSAARAAYLFQRAGKNWTQLSRLDAQDDSDASNFGGAVALAGTTLLIGARMNNLAEGAYGGSAYVYRIGADFGDAPAPYPTLVGDDGARHFINTDGPYLGSGIDPETDGQPGSGATGDDIAGYDDEDGVTIPKLKPGKKVTVTIVATAPAGTAQLDAWIDFNADGDWSDDGEQIYKKTVVNNGSNTLKLTVPATATVGQTYARLRLSPAGSGGVKPTSKVIFGEVEDYIVTIKAP